MRQTHGPYHKGTRITLKWLVKAQYKTGVREMLNIETVHQLQLHPLMIK